MRGGKRAGERGECLGMQSVAWVGKDAASLSIHLFSRSGVDEEITVVTGTPVPSRARSGFFSSFGRIRSVLCTLSNA